MKISDSRPPLVLIADDQPDVLEALRFLVKGEGYQSEAATSPAAVLDSVESRDFDVVLMDLNYARDTTSGPGGPRPADPHPGSRFHPARRRHDGLGLGGTGGGGHARAARATSFRSPGTTPRLSAILKTQIELGRALRNGQRLEAENRALRAERFPQLIAAFGRHAPGARRDFARRPLGRQRPDHRRERHRQRTGRADAHSVSLRAARPLVTVNTGGLAEGVFESELFGHVKGAFTDAKADRVGRFEMADGGTLFLDEIANISHGPAGQAAAHHRDRRVRARGLLEDARAWTCASSPPPTPTCTPRWPKAASARTCCSA